MMTSEFFNGAEVDLVKDPEVVDLINRADRETDRDLRESMYGDAIDSIADNAYFIPLWTYNVNYALTDEVDVVIHPDEIARFFNATWK